MDRSPRAQPASLASARDAGLALLGRLRRWLVVASLALVGAFAGLVAQARPGKSSGAATRAAGASSSDRRSSQQPPPVTSGEGAPAPTIAPPAQAPLPAPPAPAPPIVSGGS
jgi:hypothetical protein